MEKEYTIHEIFNLPEGTKFIGISKEVDCILICKVIDDVVHVFVDDSDAPEFGWIKCNLTRQWINAKFKIANAKLSYKEIFNI